MGRGKPISGIRTDFIRIQSSLPSSTVQWPPSPSSAWVGPTIIRRIQGRRGDRVQRRLKLAGMNGEGALLGVLELGGRCRTQMVQAHRQLTCSTPRLVGRRNGNRRRALSGPRPRGDFIAPALGDERGARVRARSRGDPAAFALPIAHAYASWKARGALNP